MLAVFVGIAGLIASFLAFCLGSYIGFEQGRKGRKASRTPCEESGHVRSVEISGPTRLVSYTCQRCGKLVEVGK